MTIRIFLKPMLLLFMLAATALAGAEGRSDVRYRPVRLGIVLPLNDKSTDGRRMIEYYRGVLMACDSLKKIGISVDVCAWNAPLDASLQDILGKDEARSRDIFIGPLYSRHMKQMAEFTKANGQLLVVPHSIDAPETASFSNIFQIFQPSADLSVSTARRFADYFSDCHTVVVDCADDQSPKGIFTSELRSQTAKRKMTCNLTSLATPDDKFAKAFDRKKRNIVVVNSASLTFVGSLAAKLRTLRQANPQLSISVFGYNEWLQHYASLEQSLRSFDVYIPSTFYANDLTPAVDRFSSKYKANFGTAMQPGVPRLALSGFDHAFFFLRGLNKYGASFDGAAGRFGYPPLQTPLKFEQASASSGRMNKAFMFVHFMADGKIETINY